MDPPAPQDIQCHWHDQANNSFSALRVMSAELGDLLFANERGNPLTPRDVRRIIDRRSPTPTHPHALRS